MKRVPVSIALLAGRIATMKRPGTIAISLCLSAALLGQEPAKGGTSPPAEWLAFLESRSLFGDFRELQQTNRSAAARALVEQTLKACPAPEPGTIPEEMQKVRWRASALWVGIRLESDRALRDGQADAANKMLQYLRDLRSLLRDFPPAIFEENGEQVKQRRTRLWVQAISEFDTNEADARAAAGANLKENEDPQTSTALWLLKSYAPYNPDESTANAEFMRETSDKFREIERLAKQAVAVRVQVSVALMKVYGWPSNTSVLEPPDGLSEKEREAFRYTESYAVKRNGMDLSVKAIHEDVSKIIADTASAKADGVVDAFAKARKSLEWKSEQNFLIAGDQKMDGSGDLLKDLIKRYDHRGIWGEGLNWSPNSLAAWTGQDKIPDATVWDVQSKLLKWVKEDETAKDKIPANFLRPIKLKFLKLTPDGTTDRKEDFDRLDWLEQRANMERDWKATSKLILDDKYGSLASRSFYGLRKDISELRSAEKPKLARGGSLAESLRDSEFGSLNVLANLEQAYLNERSPEEQRLIMFRWRMMEHYNDNGTTKESEVSKSLDLDKKAELSQRIVDFFILRWTIDQLHEGGSNKRPLWADEFLSRRQKAIEASLKPKADKNVGGK